MSNRSGCLYIVATPIGNLADISQRALEVLCSVDLIAAEDTRHSGRLLEKYAITTPMQSLHQHNESRKSAWLLDLLLAGKQIALISDAGTPLISDPGYELVCAAHEAGVTVVPIPGASALLAALSVGGLPTDTFIYAGFLPHKASARRKRLAEYAIETRTLVFFESSHRIQQCIEDMIATFGGDRLAVLARELTKLYESIRRASLAELAALLQTDSAHSRGEFVLIVAGKPAQDTLASERQLHEYLQILLPEVSVSRAAELLALLTGHSKKKLYTLALRSKESL